MVHSFTIIGDWISWKIGNGSKVLVGTNPWCGAKYYLKFFLGLFQSLRSKSIFILKDVAYFFSYASHFISKKTTYLNLSSVYVEEWYLYVKALSSIGVELTRKSETLVYTRDEKRGIPTAKVVHGALIDESITITSRWWFHYLWKCNLPLKIKCFLFLFLENKLLTQDNYQKRGGIGTNMCILCCSTLEIVEHLFVSCSFTTQVWNEVIFYLNIVGSGGKQSFTNCGGMVYIS